jgi:hypothetical protein
MFGLYAKLAVAGIVGMLVFGAVSEYRDMKNRIAVLRENNAKLELVAESNALALEEATQFATQMEEQNLELQANLQQAEVYKDSLIEKFRDHDLTRLSLKRPGMIQLRINNATKKVFDDIESLTTIDSE